MKGHKYWFLKGIRDSVPICLGYFAVSLTLGIAAVEAGMTPVQASLTSFLLNASAGEFIGFTLIKGGAGYLEVMIMEAVANARYFLMSCALSQKIDPKASLIKRLIMGYDVTDEIFGISIAAPGKLDPFYNFGAMTTALPGWALGTLVGAILGGILPGRIISALGVALYGMFIAVFVPPARKNKVVFSLVVISFIASFVFSSFEIFSQIPEGIRIILLTVIISLAAAVFFPHTESDEDKKGACEK